MCSATLQLFEKLDTFKDLHAVGENPSQNDIAEMFTLLDAAKAEHATSTGPRMEIDPRGRELSDDEAAAQLREVFTRKVAAFPGPRLSCSGQLQGCPGAFCNREATTSRLVQGASRPYCDECAESIDLDTVREPLETTVAAVPTDRAVRRAPRRRRRA